MGVLSPATASQELAGQLGAVAIDRRGLARDAQSIAGYLDRDNSCCVVVGDGCVDVDVTGEQLRWRPLDEFPGLDPDELPWQLQYLGLWQERHHFAWLTDAAKDTSEADDVVAAWGSAPQMMSLRACLPELSPADADFAATAVAMGNWHHNHAFCGRCGGETYSVQGGWERRCRDCGRCHYPRTDCAVIVSVIDRDDRLLLARNVGWQADRMSIVAGFLEPSETLENAVRREVLEETGVHVSQVTYLASQAWPFPGQLMVAFTAVADGTDLTVAEGEIESAQWFSRSEYREALADGRLRPGSGLSVSSGLIRRWFAGGAGENDPVAE